MERYKELLAEKLRLTRANAEGDQRSMFTNTEVQDILLDLWNALNLDLEFSEPVSEPVPV